MRPSGYLFLFLAILAILDAGLLFHASRERSVQESMEPVLHFVTAELGLSDLCLTTEARYTRHPAVSDSMVPFMDHPGGLEHFPSGSFFAPPDILNM